MWPDWSNSACAIIASGPSAIGTNVAALRGRVRTIAINRSFELAPWALMLYACDAKLWRTIQKANDFRGLKVCAEDHPGTQRVHIVREKDGTFSQRMHWGEVGVIGGGYNSGFQAVNLAVQLGCSALYLIGFDASLARGTHWHGEHDLPLTNPTPSLCSKWAQALDNAAGDLAMHGVSVTLAAPSAIQAYPVRDVHDWLCEYE